MTKYNVLVLLDGSEYSQLILHYVKAFLTPETHKLTLFCVIEDAIPNPSSQETLLHTSDSIASTKETLREETKAELTPCRQDLESSGFSTAVEVRFGTPVHEIDRYLDENRVDLIAMTTPGYSNLRQAMLGSVAHHLIRQGILPILLYHPIDYR